jgi:hypothetical protein
MTADSIETAGASLRFEGGILRIRSKGVHSTPESINETFAAAKTLLHGARCPILFDARQWPGGDPEGWITVISNAEEVFSAGAMLFDESAPSVVGRFPEFINRFVIPFRTFTDEAEALAFLNTQLAPEEGPG